MTAPANPLIAERVDSTTWYSGVSIVETVDLLIDGVRHGTWVDTSLAGIGTATEVVAWSVDPAGMLVAAGVGWLVEHIEPLSDALDWLAGDPDQVAAHTQTLRNASAEQSALAEEYQRAAQVELITWSGPAAEAYRGRAAHTTELLTALGRTYDGLGEIVFTAGTLVTVVRALVRDLIAQCVSLLLARTPLWSAEVGLSLGLATPHVAAQVTALVARFGAQIARLVRALVNSLSRLSAITRELDEIVLAIRTLLARLRGRPGPMTTAGTHPNIVYGPLRNEFQPGVNDPDGLFDDKEQLIGDYFADQGVNVTPIRVFNQDSVSNPDAVFRRSPDDPGTLTELKTLTEPTNGAVRDRISDAAHQLNQHGGGDLVIDGRNVGLTEAEARRGYARAVGQAVQHNQTLPETVYIILGDGRLLTLPDR